MGDLKRGSGLWETWVREAKARPGQRGELDGRWTSLSMAESPGMTFRTFWERTEQPKLPAHLRHQLLKPVPSLPWPTSVPGRWPELTLASFSPVFSNRSVG